MSRLIVTRILHAARLAGAAMLVSLLIVVPAEIISAVNEGQLPDA